MLTQEELNWVGDWQCGLSVAEVAFKNGADAALVQYAIDTYMTNLHL